MTSFILFDTGVNPTSPSRRTVSSPPSCVFPHFLCVRATPIRLVFGARAPSISRNDLAPGIARVRLTRE